MAILINVTDVKAEEVYRPPLSVYDHFYSFDAMRHYLCHGYVTDSPGHASEAQCTISLRVSIKDGTGRSFEHDLATQLVHPLSPYISLLSYIPSYLTYSARVFINTIEAETKLGNTGVGRSEESFFTIAIGQLIYAPERLPQFGIYSSFRLFKLYLETINNAGYFMLPTLRLPFRSPIERWTYPTPFSLTM
jgi:hypothetical protein